MSDEFCMLNEEQACCCTCAHHLEDHAHPLTTGGSIMVHIGWICTAPEFGFGFSGWTEHGFCEMWEARNE